MTTKDIQIPPPKLQFFDADGNPAVGWKVYTYAAGTTTKIVTYTDSSGLTPNTNPIILDDRGECSIWVPPDVAVETSDIPPGPPGPVGPPGPSGAGGIPKLTTVFTTADLMTLNTPGNFLEIYPAQGSGTTVIPVAILFENVPGTTPFTTAGDLAVSYGGADGTQPNAANGPSVGILQSNTPRSDLGAITNQTFGDGFESDLGSTTWAITADVENQPLVLWSRTKDFDDSGGVDMGLKVTVWALNTTTSAPTPTATYDVTPGLIELYSRETQSGTSIGLAGGFYEFRNIGASWDTYQFRQNPNNPYVVQLNAGLLQIKYPAIIEVNASVRGNNSGENGGTYLTITQDSDATRYWGTLLPWPSVFALSDAETLQTTSTGALLWDELTEFDANLSINTDTIGNVYTLKQANVEIKVLAVVGAITSATVHAGGTGYNVGDTGTIGSATLGYVKATYTVDTVGGGGAVTAFTINTAGLGYFVAANFPTVNAGDQPGTGTGFQVAITGVSTSSP